MTKKSVPYVGLQPPTRTAESCRVVGLYTQGGVMRSTKNYVECEKCHGWLNTRNKHTIATLPDGTQVLLHRIPCTEQYVMEHEVTRTEMRRE